MKRLFSFIAVLMAIVVSSCGYDDTAIWDKLDEHEDRIVALEELCKKANSDIEALQTIIKALQENDYVVSVAPVIEDGQTIGYTITFAKSGEVTIYNGKDGEDGKDGVNGDGGYIPNIGVKKDADGIYYWTLDGEWLLDDNGNKVRAQGEQGADGAQGEQGVPGNDGQNGQDGENGQNGQDGKDGQDGVTPKLKIEDDYWYVSYDNGATWQKLGKATTDGNSGSSIFSDVYEKDGYIYFILANGDSFKLPTSVAGAALDITFNVEQGTAIVPDTTLKIEYTITGAVGKTWVRTIGMDDEYSVAKPIDDNHGYIYFHLYEWFEDENDPGRDEKVGDEFGDVTGEDYYHNYLTIIVSVSDSSGSQITKALNFEEGVLKSVEDAYITDSTAGTVNAVIKTNTIEGSFEVVIPEKAQSWLSYNPTRAELREDTLVFSVTENLDDKFRRATINLVNNMGQTGESFIIIQRSNIANDTVVFEDPRVEALCTARFDKNLDGRLTYEEIATVTDVKDLFLLDKKIVSFNEFEYFTAVTEIPDELFANCKLLESVRLPETVITIGDYAFKNCESLTSIIIPEGCVGNSDIYFDSYCYSWFEGCSSLENVKLPSTLKHLSDNCFKDCTSLQKITIPEGINWIANYCFDNCTSLSEITCLSPIKHIGSDAFKNCQSLKYFDLSSLAGEGFGANSSFEGSGLTSVTIPETITFIDQWTFRNCKNLTDVSLHDNITWIERGAFEGCSNLKNIKLPLNLEYIAHEAFAHSGIEGEQIEGTSMKALIIPAKVTYMHNSFEGCPNLYAVKMLPMYPPTGYASFDPYTTIYVHSDVVEDYKDSEIWGRYSILPYEMMSINLNVELEFTGEPTYYDNHFNFPVSVSVNGNIGNAENVEEFGYFVKPSNDDYYYESEISYYPIEALGVDTDSSISIYSMNIDENEYIARANCEVGAYIRLVDGTVVTYDKRSVEFVYDEKPSIELLDYQITDRSVSSGYTTLYFNARYKIYGNYWIRDFDIESQYYGDYGYISTDYTFDENGIFVISGYWKYYNSDSDSTASIWIEYMCRDYNYYSSEVIEFKAGDTPELNLETSVDWFTHDLSLVTEPITFDNGSVANPWDSIMVYWGGVDVVKFKYAIFETSQLVGFSTWNIISLLHLGDDFLPFVNSDGYSGYVIGLKDNTSYTSCIYAINSEGKQYFEMKELTTAEIEATHNATQWSTGESSNYGYKFEVAGDNFSLDVHFPFDMATETSIDAGEYTYTSTTWWGYNDFIEFTTRKFIVDGVSVAVDNGRAKVSYDGNSYYIQLILNGRDGYTYVIDYNGTI
ncbi:MAG: leucine-rich repeat protein [Alistipes sp.]|nr:leucine-rich repeat protein [Alistipes sp.]